MGQAKSEKNVSDQTWWVFFQGSLQLLPWVPLLHSESLFFPRGGGHRNAATGLTQHLSGESLCRTRNRVPYRHQYRLCDASQLKGKVVCGHIDTHVRNVCQRIADRTVKCLLMAEEALRCSILSLVLLFRKCGFVCSHSKPSAFPSDQHKPFRKKSQNFWIVLVVSTAIATVLKYIKNGLDGLTIQKMDQLTVKDVKIF